MAVIYAPLVRQPSTTTGTGSYALSGTYVGHEPFSARMSIGDICRYAARAVDGSGIPTGAYEIGTGTYSALNTLTRTAVLFSSNADTPVNWAAGTKQIDLISWVDAVLGQGFEGGIGNLADRLGTISNFASPNAGGVVTGQYYDNAFAGSASGTLAGAADRFDLAPYYTSVPLTIDRIGSSVSTAVAASQFKHQIYDSDASGWPNNLLLETANISGATAAYAFASVSFTFQSGKQYWLGVRHSSTPTLRTIAVASAVNLGLTTSSVANYATILRRTLAYATAAPATFAFTNADRTANVTPPSVRFRAA